MPDCPRPSCRDRCQRMSAAGLCDWCARRLADELDDLPDLWSQVAADLARDQGAGERVTGSREAPTPVRIDALSWSGSGAPGDVVTLWPQDQTGPVPLAGVLASWARLVAEERQVSQPLPTVARMAGFLRTHAEWCSGQPWADELAEKIHAQWRVGRGLAGVGRDEVFRLPLPCPTCGETELARHNGADRITCGSCGRIWRESEYRHLVLVLAAEMREAG